MTFGESQAPRQPLFPGIPGAGKPRVRVMEEVSTMSSIKSHPIVGTNPLKVYPEVLDTDSLIDELLRA